VSGSSGRSLAPDQLVLHYGKDDAWLLPDSQKRRNNKRESPNWSIYLGIIIKSPSRFPPQLRYLSNCDLYWSWHLTRFRLTLFPTAMDIGSSGRQWSACAELFSLFYPHFGWFYLTLADGNRNQFKSIQFHLGSFCSISFLILPIL
jgi:hypothetical protein